MSPDIPDRYRPSHAGSVAVSSSQVDYTTASLTQLAVSHLDISLGDSVSWVAQDETTVCVRPGVAPDCLAMTNVYTTSRNPDQVRSAVPNAALRHLGAEIGDRVRFCYPSDRDERWLDMEVVEDE